MPLSVAHDAVAWSYARAADDRGVEIHQNTEVTRLVRNGLNGEITGVETNRGTIHAKKLRWWCPVILRPLPIRLD